MPGIRRERLEEFVAWAGKHITGDEKGQAQIFLDRLFQGFGQPGCLDVGGTTEFRVRKSKDYGGGTAFADYMWKPVVLIEMKRRGEDLSRDSARRSIIGRASSPAARATWCSATSMSSGCTTSNRKWIRPSNSSNSLISPRATARWRSCFPRPSGRCSVGDHVAVTREAADRLALWFHKLSRRADVDRNTARRFILPLSFDQFRVDGMNAIG